MQGWECSFPREAVEDLEEHHVELSLRSVLEEALELRPICTLTAFLIHVLAGMLVAMAT